MVDFKSLIGGAKVVGLILLAIVGGFSIAILGTIVVGVMSGTAVGDFTNSSIEGNITMGTTARQTIINLETSYGTIVQTAVNPYTTIAALVIVVVLVLIFFGKGGFKMGKSNGNV